MRTLFAIFAVVLLFGCGRRSDGWRPETHTFTTTQPQQSDLSGSYILAQQTITTNGISALRDQPCQLDLQSDGTFSITNYPMWTETSDQKRITNFAFTSGRWKCDTIGSTHGQPLWGIRFEAESHLLTTVLAGSKTPYQLVMIYGDGDEGTEMIFEKKK